MHDLDTPADSGGQAERHVINDDEPVKPVVRIPVSVIKVGKRLRPIDEAAVLTLMESIKRLGQIQPISVFSPDDEFSTSQLVTGAHRLEAIKRLGQIFIDVVFVDGDDVERELLEIAENLHRADLTALDRSNQIARWAELTAAKVAQLEPPSGGHQPQDKGIRKVAADLRLDRADVQRAVKVASLSDEGKQAARDHGLDDNRTALLEVAKETTPEKQVAKVTEIAEAKVQAKANRAEQPPKKRMRVGPSPFLTRCELAVEREINSGINDLTADEKAVLSARLGRLVVNLLGEPAKQAAVATEMPETKTTIATAESGSEEWKA
jgi:ParB family chromosome partitioning protein